MNTKRQRDKGAKYMTNLPKMEITSVTNSSENQSNLEIRDRSPENGDPKLANGDQKPENGYPKTETEDGNQKMEAGSCKMETRSRKMVPRSQYPVGDRPVPGVSCAESPDPRGDPSLKYIIR